MVRDADIAGKASPHLAVRVPASSANLGSGFDVLGLSLGLYAELGIGVLAPPEAWGIVEESHVATIAYRRAGGAGALWLRSHIPSGRGLGFSGAVRVGAVALGLAQVNGALEAELDSFIQNNAQQIFSIAADLEGHGDNVAASLYGGVVCVADLRVARVPVNIELQVLVWVPPFSTPTNKSRSKLEPMITRQDAVFNIGHASQLVAALGSGDTEILRTATSDRLHQAKRLDDSPQSQRAMQEMIAAGAIATWLSGSGPSVAAFAESAQAQKIADIVGAVPELSHGRVLVLDMDRQGLIKRPHVS